MFKAEMQLIVRLSFPPRPEKGRKTSSILLAVKHWESQNGQKEGFSPNIVILLPNGALSTTVVHRCRC